jgi:hypothetical protein
MKHENIKNLFNKFYSNVYEKWRVNKEKAGKDIVGEEYENFRFQVYKNYGFTFGKKTNIFNSGINADLVIMINDDIVIVEEDKGSYVDSTFLKRAIIDAATLFNTCIKEKKLIPNYILSCPTKMNNFKEVFDRTIELFNPKIKTVLKQKFIYLPLCDNGRLKRDSYYQTEINNFVLSDDLLDKQDKIIKKILQYE